MAVTTCLFAAELAMHRGETCGMHSHSCTELIYYHHCRGFLVQNGHRLSYAHGCVSVYQPQQPHSDECEKSGTQICVGVAGCSAERLPMGLWPATPAVRSAFFSLRDELKRKDDEHQAALDLQSGQIVIALRRMLADVKAMDRPANTHASDCVNSAKLILETRFGQPLRIKKLADELFVSPDFLRQMFRLQIGEPPLHYLLRRRIEHACELLHWTDMPIKQVANRVGIGNPYYFSRIFHRWIGKSPSTYRTQQQAKNIRSRTPSKTG